MTKQYIGDRYIMLCRKNCEWDKNLKYEHFEIVQHEGITYLSKKSVPKDVDITNTEYWLKFGDDNLRLNALEKDYLTNKSDIENRLNKCEQASKNDIVFLGNPLNNVITKNSIVFNGKIKPAVKGLYEITIIKENDATQCRKGVTLERIYTTKEMQQGVLTDVTNVSRKPIMPLDAYNRNDDYSVTKQFILSNEYEYNIKSSYPVAYHGTTSIGYSGLIAGDDVESDFNVLIEIKLIQELKDDYNYQF